MFTDRCQFDVRNVVVEFTDNLNACITARGTTEVLWVSMRCELSSALSLLRFASIWKIHLAAVGAGAFESHRKFCSTIMQLDT